ncbi:response regulator transcription factor [Limosilactobacillus fastidiosus]|uniref:Response regulator transcription factor n=1 Tax=Limosilactobacillus fastidiosus TaxID=2759855 RepID=A0A7W3TYR4_9LACO|nr:response regulator transcription factor [Limosilactobacillus fastidiosus]MBB1062668.1 response regulator transcription factor [Limosilactobacillus fastidiosus]MBB1085766.1 response regulator transcription factor [Limosilactobacillus fastidiosus]MCD7083962.1 response regulator transcription factor [Limosilactobacillus fastidiosus]MCD7085897.1 response regulator transcription factor [Limosilactobacillus fastidiosus]MCD7113974.1 response regulator transcription factor [Limosilactobacillus fast
MVKVFVVEDNPIIIKTVKNELEKWQYAVVTVKDWDQVTDEVKEEMPDIILFDITLPTFDGFYWINAVRQLTKAPIIVISAADIDSNIMHAIASGADDYIMKPFSATVLLAKIQALLRRNQKAAGMEKLAWGSSELNSLTNKLTTPNGNIQLSPTESALLGILINHLNHTVTKERLLEWLWQGGKFLNDNTLNVNISRLRSKLATVNLDKSLRTERGIGYRLVIQHEI